MRLPRPHPTPLQAAAGALAVALLAGCGSAPSLPEVPDLPKLSLPGIYRIDIEQGNVVDAEMLAQIEPGMDRRKVQFLLGTPLLVDPFNPNRWEYFYSIKPGGGDREHRRVSIYFDGDVLERIEGDIEPASPESLASVRKDVVVTVPHERPPEGFLERLKPDFLGQRVGRRQVSTLKTGDEAPAAEASAETVASAATPEVADPPEPAGFEPDDTQRLGELFQGYGRGETSAPAAPAQVEAAAAEADAAPGPTAEDAEEDPSGPNFFQRLVERLREAREAEANPAPEPEADTALPPPELPAPTDR